MSTPPGAVANESAGVLISRPCGGGDWAGAAPAHKAAASATASPWNRTAIALPPRRVEPKPSRSARPGSGKRFFYGVRLGSVLRVSRLRKLGRFRSFNVRSAKPAIGQASEFRHVARRERAAERVAGRAVTGDPEPMCRFRIGALYCDAAIRLGEFGDGVDRS